MRKGKLAFSLDTIKALVKEFEDEGFNKTDTLVGLADFFKQMTDNNIKLTNPDSDEEYAIEVGEGLSGIGGMFYLESKCGTNDIYTAEFDAPTFIKLGFGIRDMVNASRILAEESR